MASKASILARIMGAGNTTIANPAISSPAISNATLTSPTITSPTISNATLTSPTISNATLTSPTISNATLTAPVLGTPASGDLSNCAGVQYTGFKNRIINGNMAIDQRNAGAIVSTAANAFDVDRWKLHFSGGGVATVQQSSTVPSSTTFTNSVVLTVTTPDSSLAAGDYYGIVQYIEGYNVADLGFGTSAAAPVTLSFWVRSSVTGTYSVAFSNQDGATRTYVATYTINSANTWEQKTITVAGDTTGAWNKTNSNGLRIWFALGMGSTYETANPNAWESTAAIQSTSSLDWIATNGATLYITGVQLEKGSTATSFDYRPYSTELALCQRYFTRLGGEALYTPFSMGYYRASYLANFIIPLPVQMRASPTCTIAAPNNFFVSQGGANSNPSAISTDQVSPLSIMLDATTSSYTIGYSTRIFGANSLSATISASAEL